MPSESPETTLEKKKTPLFNSNGKKKKERGKQKY